MGFRQIQTISSLAKKTTGISLVSLQEFRIAASEKRQTNDLEPENYSLIQSNQTHLGLV